MVLERAKRMDVPGGGTLALPAGSAAPAWLFRPSGPTGRSPCVVLGDGPLLRPRPGTRRATASGSPPPDSSALAYRLPPLRRQRAASRGHCCRRSGCQRQDLRRRARLRPTRSDHVDPRPRSRSGVISLGGGQRSRRWRSTSPEIAAAICVAPVIDGLRSLLHIGGPRTLAQADGGRRRRPDRGRCDARRPRTGSPATGPPGSGGRAVHLRDAVARVRRRSPNRARAGATTSARAA